MYRRMGPKQLEKVIEEVKQWKKPLSTPAIGVVPKISKKEANVGVNSVESQEAVDHTLQIGPRIQLEARGCV